jgi:hypothetical protein
VVVDGLRPGSECEYQVALDGAVCWPEPGSEFPPSGLLNTSVQVGSALGLGALAAIASIVTGSRLPGHTMAAALTDGYVAGLLAGSVIFAAGALVAVFTINARISAA